MGINSSVACYLYYFSLFRALAVAQCEKARPLYGWTDPDIENPYQQADTTPITSTIVRALAHAEVPLTTSELWDRIKVTRYHGGCVVCVNLM